MPLTTCQRCEKMYSKNDDSKVCPKCKPSEEEDYEVIRDALQTNPNMTAEQLSDSTGVDFKCVVRLIDEGRIQNVGSGDTIKCGRCGAPAISLSKKLCEACLNKLNADLAKEQSKIRLPKRKEVELGTALNVPEEKSITKRTSRGLEFRQGR